MPQVPFVGASYQERSKNLDAQACINFFPVMGESGSAKSVAALYGTPGTRRLTQLDDAPVRGIHVPTNGGALLIVSGASVYRVVIGLNVATSITKIGSVEAGTTPVCITDNGAQAVIVNGTKGYVVDLTTNTVLQIADPAFYGASSVDILITYMIFNRPGTNQFYISGSDAVTFDALDFASAESNAEPIVRLLVSHSDIVIFKKTVTEIWRPNGNADFPFSRDTNAAIEQGCAAPWSAVTMDNSVFWIGNAVEGGGIVWRLDGYTPRRVSTDALEYAIASYGDISDAVGYSYQQEGHTFYVLSFPSAGITWCYDAATNLWHQRAYLNPETGNLERHRSNMHAYYGGLHIVGDYVRGDLYALDLDYYSDGSDPMPSIRAASHISGPDYQWMIHNRLQIDMEVGFGLQEGYAAQPRAMLDWSDDGGHTWSREHWASIGRQGEYAARVRWNQLGRARNRVYRVTISDPVKRVILGAALNPDQ
jgi:hypothetical protein